MRRFNLIYYVYTVCPAHDRTTIILYTTLNGVRQMQTTLLILLTVALYFNIIVTT